MGDVTRLVLIRHGEARAALDRVVGGDRGCTGLSDRGRVQAEALRDRLARTGEVSADVLLASTLPRAVETADIIAPSLGRLPVMQDCDLCELHPGECDALSWEEYDARYGVDMANDLYAPMSPGGESLAEFVLRVGRALHRLAKEHEGRNVVVACHGGVVIGSMINFFGLPVAPALRPDLFVENTSITEWQKRDGRWSLVRFNDVAHLEALNGSGS
jgi:probable phosphoglycerate mutase